MATEASVSLYDSTDISLWRAALGCYEEAVKAVAAQKKKSAKSKTEGLVQLDTWFQNVLPTFIASRVTPHLTHEELAKLMKWKLMRGKFRPRLTELVQQNDPAEVEKVTQDAIAALPNLETAVKTLTRLKAVGPATASAILCAAAPDQVPFMADESVLAVPELGKLEYNLKHYLAFTKKIEKKTHQLNKLDKQSTKKWTPHDVELALWSFHFTKKLKPELLRTSDCPTNSTKCDSESENSDAEPPSKKHKASKQLQ